MAAMGEQTEKQGTLVGRVAGRVTRAMFKAVGGAVYYAIYRKLPNVDEPNPYWSEMHPDDDKGEAGEDRQHFAQPPPSI